MLRDLHIHLYNSQIIWCENKIILRAIETGLQLNIILPDQFLNAERAIYKMIQFVGPVQ